MLDEAGAAHDAVEGVGYTVVRLQPEGAVRGAAARAGVFVHRAEEPRQLVAQVQHAVRAVAQDLLRGLDGDVVDPDPSMQRPRGLTLRGLIERFPIRQSYAVGTAQLGIDTIERLRGLVEDRCLHRTWIADERDPQPRRFGPTAVLLDPEPDAVGDSGCTHRQ